MKRSSVLVSLVCRYDLSIIPIGRRREAELERSNAPETEGNCAVEDAREHRYVNYISCENFSCIRDWA